MAAKMQAKKQCEKYVMEKCQSEYDKQISFKYFVKPFSITYLLSKVSEIQSTISGGTLKH